MIAIKSVVCGLLVASLAPSVLAEEVSLIDPQLSQFQNVYAYGKAEVVGDVIELNSIGNFFLLTQKTYKNFVFKAEVKMPAVTEYSNSGIIFRAQLKPTQDGYHEAAGYQAEVDPSARKWSGGLYDQARRDWLYPTHATRSHPDHHFIRSVLSEWTEQQGNAYKPGEWNQYRIECRGSNIKIYLNDILTTHVIDTKDAEGLIGLQHHGSKKLQDTGKTDNVVRFRNVTIRELD
ncbi:DUF1080 domain-containing protein [uncultured Paraglaciecola sp.]|uniref:3-keto-disaccharide hydrolase n=1 Tax=uncultured Paraglaciecola sp. TaxID=1765024 RepID=UPI0030DC9631|tara:strand:- start:34896 stop:35594 length:699 start_codon:yes stop_codon:yes gene_type:complete